MSGECYGRVDVVIIISKIKKKKAYTSSIKMLKINRRDFMCFNVSKCWEFQASQGHTETMFPNAHIPNSYPEINRFDFKHETDEVLGCFMELKCKC